MRFRIPQELISVYGKSHIAYSLNTKDAAQAKLLSYLHSYHIAKVFNTALENSKSDNVTLNQYIDYDTIRKQVLDIGRDAVLSSSKSDISTVISVPDNILKPLIKKKKRPVFSEVWKKYVTETGITIGTVADFKTHINRFIAICGDKQIDCYEFDDFRHYKEIMIEFPAYVYTVDKIRDFDKFIADQKRKNPNYRKLFQKNEDAIIDTSEYESCKNGTSIQKIEVVIVIL